MGSCVWSTLAKMAVNTITSMMKPPTAPSGFLRQKRRSTAAALGRAGRRTAAAGAGVAVRAPLTAAIAHPRIEHAVEHVHGEIREDHDGGGEHDQGLHDRVVAPRDGLHEEAR